MGTVRPNIGFPRKRNQTLKMSWTLDCLCHKTNEVRRRLLWDPPGLSLAQDGGRAQADPCDSAWPVHCTGIVGRLQKSGVGGGGGGGEGLDGSEGYLTRVVDIQYVTWVPVAFLRSQVHVGS